MLVLSLVLGDFEDHQIGEEANQSRLLVDGERGECVSGGLRVTAME